jgi:hypothetical protein
LKERQLVVIVTGGVHKGVLARRRALFFKRFVSPATALPDKSYDPETVFSPSGLERQSKKKGKVKGTTAVLCKGKR